MVLIALVLGALLGWAWGAGAFDAAAGALMVGMLMQVRRQGARIAALERALEAVQSLRNSPAMSTSNSNDIGPQPAHVGDTEVPTLEVMPAVPPALERTMPADVQSVPNTSEGPTTFNDVARPGALTFKLWTKARDWFLGGNTIAKAGVGILFIGLAFLAKYAAEHSQVSVEVRLSGIGGVALVLLGLGWRLRIKRPGYAQALQGGAVAVLYLTLFVAFRFYGLMAVGPVFALMVAVAALAAALAVLQDARALAVIGALGGFATPLLVSTGSGNQIALFSYYLLLDLGIAAVAWFKSWRMLNAVGFTFTFAVSSIWGALSYVSSQYASSQAFLVAYFLLFNAMLLMPARHLSEAPTPRSENWVNGSLLFGLPTITFALQHGLVRHMAYGTALSALVMAGFYVLIATRMKRQPIMALPFDATLAIAIVLLILVVPFALDARSTAGAWALEGAGLVWLGLRQDRRLTRAFGYALHVLAGGALVLGSLFHDRPTAMFNDLFLNSLLAAAGALASGYFAQSPQSKASVKLPGERFAEPLLIGLGCFWALAAVHVQVDAFVLAPFTLAAWLLGLIVIALALTVLCARLRWPTLAWPTMGFAPGLAGLVGASAATLASPMEAGGWWAWPLALAAHLAVLWRAALHWPALAPRVMHALGLLILAALGALQGRAITAAWGDDSSAWAWLGWLALPALLLWLLPRAAFSRLWPIAAAPSAYQGLAGAVLAMGLLLWTLLANVFSNGSALPLPFVPLLNPLDLGVACALLAAWLWLRSPAASAVLAQQPQAPVVLLASAGFVWLNAMLVRAFHHYADVPYRFDAWVHSLAVQTGITLLWSATALALMWLSAQRHLRMLWIVGAALLAAVVLKLLLVDLSGSGTVTRIVSFIGVGVLMLLIAYVAPLPSSESNREAR